MTRTQRHFVPGQVTGHHRYSLQPGKKHLIVRGTRNMNDHYDGRGKIGGKVRKQPGDGSHPTGGRPDNHYELSVGSHIQDLLVS
jgi:hypothetical protein